MPIKDRYKVTQLAMRTLKCDRDHHLIKIDEYEQGKQDLPYTPELADKEYVQLAKRSITNVINFMVSTPAQMMFVDSFRRGRTSDEAESNAEIDQNKLDVVQPEWDHWQESRMDARQSAVYRGALKFGHAFVWTFKDDAGKVISKGLSALNTTALYTDPANDDDPYAVFAVTRWPNAETDEVGLGMLVDDTYTYDVIFKNFDDTESVVVKAGKRHGASVCPVTRFAAAVDLEGRTCGIVEPMIVLQDRINQTVFDLLIVQSYASFKVRTIAGMAPPIKMKAVDFDGNTIENPDKVPLDEIADWVPMIDPRTGQPVPDEIQLNAKRLLIAEDHETKFSTLDETPLDGFIAAIQLGFRHMAALSQTPPHHILGEISNLSAEALNAAEVSLARKVDEFKAQFGESWERVFRIAAELDGEAGADDFSGEVIWRDMGNANLSQVGDALGKMAESLGIPKRGLWRRVPNVTSNELTEWNELYKEEQPELALARNAEPASTSTRPAFRASQVLPQQTDQPAA